MLTDQCMLFTWKAWEILFPFFPLHVVVVLFYCGTAIYNKSLKFHGFSRMLANVKSPRCIWLKGWVCFLQIYSLFYLSFMFPSPFRLFCVGSQSMFTFVKLENHHDLLDLAVYFVFCGGDVFGCPVWKEFTSFYCSIQTLFCFITPPSGGVI